MADCTCDPPQPTESGICGTCGGFACPYAHRGRTRCSSAICDCFIEEFPDSPFGLHPEAYAIGLPPEPPIPGVDCPDG